MRKSSILFEFVDLMPPKLEEGFLYISIEYATASHLCLCGCGERIVTPLSPTDWSLTFDGDTVTLRPSIGNWDLPCKSHYNIMRNNVQWSSRWSREQVLAARDQERDAKATYYEEPATAQRQSWPDKEEATLAHRLLKLFRFRK